MSATAVEAPSQVFAIFIRASREHVWQALTESDYTLKYYYASAVESDWEPGSPLLYKIGEDTAIVAEIVEATPPEKLVTTFDARWDDAVRADTPSRITWILEEAAPASRSSRSSMTALIPRPRRSRRSPAACRSSSAASRRC